MVRFALRLTDQLEASEVSQTFHVYKLLIYLPETSALAKKEPMKDKVIIDIKHDLRPPCIFQTQTSVWL